MKKAKRASHAVYTPSGRCFLRPKFSTRVRGMPYVSYEEWAKHYKPMKNHIDTNAPYDGFMFETYGAEIEYVLLQVNSSAIRRARVWTVVECGNTTGDLYIVPGYHLVNRIGYFVTEKGIEPEMEKQEMQVKAS